MKNTVRDKQFIYAYFYLWDFVPLQPWSQLSPVSPFVTLQWLTIRPPVFLISGEPIDIMKPRAVAACNDRIARDVVRLIREADQRVEMRAK